MSLPSCCELTAERARELLRYDPETGRLFYRTGSARHPAGREVTGRNAYGHVTVCLDGKRYYAHRVAWLCMTGAWPINEVDHINGIKHDNRFVNLRDISHKDNITNRIKPNANGESGYLGVSRRWRKWVAFFRGKYLGARPTAEEAHQLYLSARSEWEASL